MVNKVGPALGCVIPHPVCLWARGRVYVLNVLLSLCSSWTHGTSLTERDEKLELELEL